MQTPADWHTPGERMLKTIGFMALFSASVAEAGGLPQERGILPVSTPVRSTAHWIPSAASLEGLESRLQLPPGSRALREYTRYYAADPKHGSHAVQGVLINEGDGALNIVPASKLPRILDGGCHVINIFYDLDDARSLRVF